MDFAIKPPDDSPELLVRIESLSFGGDGVGRLDGRVIFVADAAPGDLVRVRIHERHDRFARARIVEVVEPGAARVEPRCRYFGVCGGCTWQHVDYAHQLEAKEAGLREALRRIGGTEPEIDPIVPSPLEYRYRTRTRIHLSPSGEPAYMARGSNELVVVEECAILDETLEARLRARHASAGSKTRAAAARQEHEGAQRRTGTAMHDGIPMVELSVDTAGRIDEADRAPGNATGVRDLGLRGGTRAYRGSRAQPGARTHHGAARRRRERDRGRDGWDEGFGLPFHQANGALNRLLVSHVGARLRARAHRGAINVLDLFCGDGNLSLPLRDCAAAVVGFDASDRAVGAANEAARAGREAYPLTPIYHAADLLHAGPGRTLMADIARGFASQTLCVIADPPRSGLRPLIAALAALAPSLLLYVSCNPPVLARDAADLRAAGFALKRVTPFDMFPQTYHLEAVAEFEHTGSSPAHAARGL